MTAATVDAGASHVATVTAARARLLARRAVTRSLVARARRGDTSRAARRAWGCRCVDAPRCGC